MYFYTFGCITIVTTSDNDDLLYMP